MTTKKALEPAEDRAAGADGADADGADADEADEANAADEVDEANAADAFDQTPTSADYSTAFSPRNVAVGLAIIAGLVAFVASRRRRKQSRREDG
jgi:hypothetical protein